MGRHTRIALLITSLTGAPTGAQELGEEEGEAFLLHDYHNIGGLDLWMVECGSASGNHAMDGMDVAGEWIQLEVTLPVAGCWADSMRFQGIPDDANGVRLIIPGAGPGGSDFVSEFGYVGAGLG